MSMWTTDYSGGGVWKVDVTIASNLFFFLHLGEGERLGEKATPSQLTQLQQYSRWGMAT